MLVVVNIGSLMRSALCGKLHRPSSQMLFALQQSSINSQLQVQYRDPPPCIRRPRYGGPRRNIAIRFATEKLEWCGYPMVKKISRYDYWF